MRVILCCLLFMGCWIPAPSDLDSVGEGYIMLFVVMDLQAG